MLPDEVSGFFTSISGIMACIGALSLILASLRIGRRRGRKTPQKTSGGRVQASPDDDDEHREPNTSGQFTKPPPQPKAVQVQVDDGNQDPEASGQVINPPPQPEAVQVQVDESIPLQDPSPTFLVLTAEPHQPSCMTTPPRPARKPNAATDVKGETHAGWEVAFDRNLRRSTILRLPDELLLKILGATDTAGLFMLRQASFTFWRLYHDRTFSKYHRASTDPFRQTRAAKRFEDNRETVRQARKSALCGSCLRTRESPDYKERIRLMQRQLHCSRCKANHRYVQFSQDQRKTVDDRARECIGAQGRLRLCAHKTVQPAALVRRVRRDGGAEMRPHDHRVVDECRLCADVAFRGGTAGGRSPEVSPPAISVLRSAWPEYVGSVRAEEITYLVGWTLPVLEVPEDERVSDGHEVRGALDGLGRAYGDVLCPHFTFRDGQLLRPFDPRYCVCFGHDSRVGGGGGPASDTGCEPGVPDVFSCRRRSLKWPEDPSGRTFISHPYGSGIRRHAVKCGFCETTYSWRRKGRDVFLQRVSAAVAENPKKTWTASLHRFLEPRSYGATSDEETKHLLWCDDVTCKNGRNWEVYSKQF